VLSEQGEGWDIMERSMMLCVWGMFCKRLENFKSMYVR
jgi:hypothetical protein